MGQYDPPAHYGIPNPLGPRTHNWKGGLLNEGSLYHGPVYTRPMNQFPWMQRPLNGAMGQGVPEVTETCAPPWQHAFFGAVIGAGITYLLVKR